MINKSPSLLVPSQVPEFIATDAPKFVEFLQAYYQFLGEYSYDVQRIRDIDQTTADLVSFLKSELAARYPTAAVDDRKLIRIIRSLYRAKGTLNAVEMLFQIFFNEAVTIQQPGQNILRASDGRWSQEFSILVELQYGAIDYSKPIVLKIENDSGIFYIEVDRYEAISATGTRFFFKSYRQINFDAEQYVDVLHDDGSIAYRGLLVKSPSRLRVVSPGHSWKVGQVILLATDEQVVINGVTVEALPTIARVTQVGPNGELISVEIIQYGTYQTGSQSVLVSPFPNPPPSADWELDYQIIGVDIVEGEQVPRYGYTLTLNSYTDGVKESIFGATNARGGDSYFLEDYTLDFYNARVVLQQERNVSARSLGVIVTDPSLTRSMWLSSRAALIYELDYIVKYKGSFADDHGQVSNTNIRLQDNYFYQLFSYVIQTTKQIAEYRNALNLIHPAGLKYFGELTKTSAILLTPQQLQVIQSRSRIYLADQYYPIDSTTFDVVKPLAETLSIYEDIVSFNVVKALEHAASIDDEVVDFDVSKSISDLFVGVDATTFNATKSVTDTTSASDPATFSVVTTNTEQPSATETIAKHVTPATTQDTSDASDGSATINTVITLYNAEDYFDPGEHYASIGFALTIG